MGVIQFGSSSVTTSCTSNSSIERAFNTSTNTFFVRWANVRDANLLKASALLFWDLGICLMLHA
ncbi:hypothetical protein Hanom_Chr05g00456511 [Helianthus anomalus]